MRLFLYLPYIFTALNLYVFWRMRAGFGPGRWQWGALLFFAAMIFLFMQRRAVIGTVWETAVHAVSLLWVGVLLITVTWLLGLDALRLLARLTDFLAGTHLSHMLRPSRSVPVVLGLCCLLSVYALFEAANIRTERLTIVTDKLPAGTERLRIAVMSDVHINALTGLWRLERMAGAVKGAESDILVMLGDFVDTDMRGKTAEAALFRDIPTRYGAYAILGNHEAYSGLDNAVDFISRAGFTLLRSESIQAGGVTIVGVDDPMFLGGRSPAATAAEEALCLKLLRDLKDRGPGERFTLLLRHRPGTHSSIAGLFDLQLSGHTHGGQIWPAGLLVGRANNGFRKGMYAVSGPQGTSRVYVTPGTGVWGPPMRFLTPPEVTVIDLISARQ